MLEARVAAGLVLLVAATFDLRHRIIPDWASVALVALFLLVNIAGGHWQVVGSGALAAGFLFLAGAGAFARGWLGGGDVKLMSALGCWAGLSGLGEFVMMTSLAGGALSLVYAGRALVKRVPLRQVALPYGVAIALGGLPELMNAH